MIDEPAATVPVNRIAIISMIAGFLTLLSFCTAIAPIPLIGWACYPSAAILGMFALVTGIASLAQIKTRNENGRAYALVGIWVGGLAILASACAIATGILVFPRVVAVIRQYVK